MCINVNMLAFWYCPVNATGKCQKNGITILVTRHISHNELIMQSRRAGEWTVKQTKKPIEYMFF